MSTFIPTIVNTKHPLSDSMGNPLSIAYTGPNNLNQPFAAIWNGETIERFTAEEITEILASAQERTTPKGNKRLVINW